MLSRNPLERFLALLARMIAGAVAGVSLLFLLLYDSDDSQRRWRDADGLTWEWAHVGLLAVLCIGGGALLPLLATAVVRLLGWRRASQETSPAAHGADRNARR